jgi:hypothetical protein
MKSRFVSCLHGIAVIAALMPSASPALAESVFFKTPSGNIHCGYDDYEGTPFIRCDISNYTPSAVSRPADCDLDWGGAFAISADGTSSIMVCHGDTVMTPDALTLAYGDRFAREGISCLSEQKGLTCRNARGHGFFLSRARQEMF